ncbi:MAG: branched-chain amino acid ABC transporter permease [Actinomycetota bacterium]
MIPLGLGPWARTGIIFGGFALGIALLTFIERKVGEPVRRFYDKNERWAFPTGFLSFILFGALLIPLVSDKVQVELAFTVGVFALLSLGLNVVVGFAGLLDLGYVAFFAIGAYTMGILSNSGPIQIPWELEMWEVLPIAVAITLLAGFLLGAPTLRLRGDYLAIVTLGFGEIVRIVAENLDSVTRGSKGIIGIPPPKVPFTGSVFNVGNPTTFYLTVFGFLAAMVLVIRRLNHSRVGRYWAAIREDEVAAEAMGVPTLKYKLWAFAIGASTSGFAGVIYASRVGFISPESFQLIISITILAMVVLGGLGSIAGALVGAAIIQMIPEVLRSLPDEVQDARFLIFGAILVAMMIFRPQGVIPSRRRAAELKGEVQEAGVTAMPGEAPPADVIREPAGEEGT